MSDSPAIGLTGVTMPEGDYRPPALPQRMQEGIHNALPSGKPKPAPKHAIQTMKTRQSHRPSGIQDQVLIWLGDHPGRTSAQVADALGLERRSAQNAIGRLRKDRVIHITNPGETPARYSVGNDETKGEDMNQPATPRIAEAIAQVRAAMQRPSIDPNTDHVLRELQQIMPAEIAQVLASVRRALGVVA
jgi:hypothetical protein